MGSKHIEGLKLDISLGPAYYSFNSTAEESGEREKERHDFRLGRLVLRRGANNSVTARRGRRPHVK